MTPPPSARNFEEILWQTQARVRAYIAGMGISPIVVDELAQETYLQFYRNMEKIPGDVPPEVWVKGIAKNVCLNHLRKNARRGRLYRHAVAEILANTTTRLERLSSQEAFAATLDDCLSQLPADRQRVLKLHYQQELSSWEIAEKTQATPDTVQTWLHRIRATLTECVTRKLARRP